MALPKKQKHHNLLDYEWIINLKTGKDDENVVEKEIEVPEEEILWQGKPDSPRARMSMDNIDWQSWDMLLVRAAFLVPFVLLIFFFSYFWIFLLLVVILINFAIVVTKADVQTHPYQNARYTVTDKNIHFLFPTVNEKYILPWSIVKQVKGGKADDGSGNIYFHTSEPFQFTGHDWNKEDVDAIPAFELINDVEEVYKSIYKIWKKVKAETY